MSSLGLEEVVVYRRDTPPLEWTLTDEDGAVFPLSGWTAKLSAKASLEDADADRLFDESVTLNADTGIATVKLPAAALATDGRFVCELRLLKAGSPAEELTVHQFLLIVRKDVL